MASAQAKHLTSKFTVYTVKIPFIIWDFRFGPRCTSGLRSTITRAFRGVDCRYVIDVSARLYRDIFNSQTVREQPAMAAYRRKGRWLWKAITLLLLPQEYNKNWHTQNKHSIANNKYTAQCLQPPRCSRNWYIMNIFLWDIMQHENQYQEIYAVTAICCINID